MNSQGTPEAQVARRSRRPGGEDSIEARRYVDALRRRMWPILLLALSAMVTAYAISSWMPDRYKATASIVKQVTTGPYESVNVEALTRELSTIEQLLHTSDVLAPAAKQVKGETSDSIGSSLESSVDPEANLIFLTATADEPKKAAQIANAVATTFIAAQRAVSPAAVRAGAGQPRAGAQPRPRPAGPDAAGAGDPAAAVGARRLARRSGQ